MTDPVFESVDDYTTDLLTLVALGSSTGTADAEWDLYVAALATVAARHAGLIFPNELRPMVRGKVKPQRIGALRNRAIARGLVKPLEQADPRHWEVSNDHEGRNIGKPAAVVEWVGGDAA
jgi:hypothetical protein